MADKLDELKFVLADLNQAVADFKAGRLDQGTVDRIAASVLEQQGAAPRRSFDLGDSPDPFGGYAKSDIAQLQGRDRFEAVLTSPAG